MNKDLENMKLDLDDLESVSGGVELTMENSPAAGTYIVQEGDSLHSIAEKFGMSTKILFINNMPVIIKAANEHGYTSLNPVDYAEKVYPGTVLQVPVKHV